MPKEKGKKSKEPKISYFQAITTYKINIKEKELKEAEDELSKLVEKNQNLRERNARLIQTKEHNIQKALDDYKNFTTEINSRKRCDKDEVISEMKDLWKFKQSQEKELLVIKKEIKKSDKEINNSKRELRSWHDFKNRGTHDINTHIKLLKKELADMNDNYEIISKSLRTNLVSTIDQIKKNTEDVIQRKNKIVAEKCFKDIDKSAIDMSRDNSWMKEKIEIFTKELKELQEYTTNLEQENIKLMSYLFECNNQEVKFIKDVFSNQFLDNENLEENSIMNVDLDTLDSVRPNSALDFTLRKLREIDLKTQAQNNQLVPYEEPTDEEDDYVTQDYAQKTLHLDGHKKKLIKPPTPSAEEVKAFDYKGDEWPITQEMLNNALKHN